MFDVHSLGLSFSGYIGQAQCLRWYNVWPGAGPYMHFTFVLGPPISDIRWANTLIRPYRFPSFVLSPLIIGPLWIRLLKEIDAIAPHSTADCRWIDREPVARLGWHLKSFRLQNSIQPGCRECGTPVQ